MGAPTTVDFALAWSVLPELLLLIGYLVVTWPRRRLRPLLIRFGGPGHHCPVAAFVATPPDNQPQVGNS